MKVRVHVFVSGRVQGVFFRWETKRVAEAKNVKGCVRNLEDGRVEAIFEGEEGDVAQVVDFCRSGPPLADVDNIEVSDEKYTGKFKVFNVLH